MTSRGSHPGWTAALAVALLVATLVAATGAAADSEPSSAPASAPAAPERDLLPYEPKPLDVVRDPSALAGARNRRAIVIERGTVVLLRGAEVQGVRRIPSGSVSLTTIADAVGDRWIEESEPGVFLARAAIAQAPGTSLTVGGDGTTALRLSSRPHVFVGGVGSHALFEGVTVTSWDESTGRPVERPETPEGRPFILYENGSDLRIVDSEIAYLGYDRSTAYGLSWREGSTGSLIDSDVHHNFFGAYTFRAHDIEFSGSTYHHNIHYGLDPHDDSSGLLVTGNEAYENGSHGIIFSVRVVDSVVRDNFSHDNGGNGIVMDFESDGNVVQGNRVEDNRGDGIVILGSSDVLVRDNVVSGNRVGLRVNHESHRNLLTSNRVTANERGAHVYDGADQTRLEHNEFVGSIEVGLVIEENDTVSFRDMVEGGPTGVELRSPGSLIGTTVENAETGVAITERGIGTLRDIRIEASEIGVAVAPGGIVRLWSSRVEAPTSLTGPRPRIDVGNDFRQPLSALPWFAIVGIAFLSAAVGLQFFHRARNRTSRTPAPIRFPTGVHNP